jgi:hypothetical protein
MILCEELSVDPDRPGRLSILGVITTVHSRDDPPFPLLFERLTVGLFLTGGRGTGNASVTIRLADTDERISGIRPRPLTFGSDPLAVRGLAFNLHDIRFPSAGLYLVQFVVDDEILAQEPLLVK